jgi:hypothetical protein
VTVPGLTNGTAYTFTVTATNTAGTSPASAASAPVTPAAAPTAPTAVTATAGDGSVQVSWAAPASNGGAPITSYTVTASPGGQTVTVTGAPPATAVTVPGLTNGTAYTFTVTATNTAGTSPASAASTPVTPAAAPPGLFVADTVLTRPTSGTAQANFTVTLSSAATTPVNVTYQTADGTAKAGPGYVALPATTLTFAPGETSKTVPVTINGSGVHGIGSTDFHLSLSAASGATIADGDGRARLINTLGPLAISVTDTTVQQSASTPTTADFTLSLSAPTAAGESASVMVSTTDASAAAADGDYSALPATKVTFAPGTQTATVHVPVGAATGPEPNEVFNLVLASQSPNAVIARTKARATIVNGGVAPGPGLYVADTALLRPTSGTTQANFTVTLAAPGTAPVTVTYQTADGAAKAGTDYVAVPATTLTFAPGETSKTVPVTIIGRGVHGSGTIDLHLLLSNATGAAIADGDGKARLINALGPLSISVTDAVAQQSGTAPTTATFTLSLSSLTAAGESATVVVSTANGSATAADGDYTALPATTVIFAPGTQTATVSVPVGAAAGPEPAEVFTLNLATTSANAVIARNRATATITNTGH